MLAVTIAMVKLRAICMNTAVQFAFPHLPSKMHYCECDYDDFGRAIIAAEDLMEPNLTVEQQNVTRSPHMA